MHFQVNNVPKVLAWKQNFKRKKKTASFMVNGEDMVSLTFTLKMIHVGTVFRLQMVMVSTKNLYALPPFSYA